MSTELLRLDGVSRQYGHGETARTALVGIDLTIMAGEMVAVMGASGSGKSTLLTIAGGLTTPTSGEVVIDGQWISSMTAKQLAVLRRRTLGFVFQDFNLIPALTALENVTLPLELDSWRSRDSRRAGLDALASVDLVDRAGNYPDDLSGGQQQRVAIARAIVGTRKLILADEPTGALDSHTGEVVLRMLRHRVDAGAGAIMVTHDARHAAWADRIVYLEDGRIVGQSSTGSPEELLGAGR
ncbi:ABC transporter ATP-binding protein [Cryobacterium suzukii]|uniref:ABC transporter ATP-binding protein n=1 Tax=Cryobacterium suzukii TaxID=1259198 RepID=A0A4R9AIF3_9MICO|nr:ABC transporter ATP-binding protein [Cryobacterium suzukii]TFD62747.1 ABC transporter ATP-binding protein [Cryobacterium suzukii]